MRKWFGVDKQDGQQRLMLPNGNVQLMSKIDTFDLIQIAWKLDVSNPEGLNANDCEFLGLPRNHETFNIYKVGWELTSKEDIINCIWNRLVEIDCVVVK